VRESNIDSSGRQVCGRSLAGVAGLNPSGDIDVCVVCVLQSRTKGKARTTQTKDQVRIRYNEKT
jgi:hypothetical protein